MVYSYLLLFLGYQRKLNLQIFNYFLQSPTAKSLLLQKASVFKSKAILEILQK